MSKNTKELIKYWQLSAKHDYETMLGLLSEIAGLILNKDELKIINSVNRFNIRVRYPDIKLNFYKSFDKKNTERFLASIEKLYRKLCQNLEEKK